MNDLWETTKYPEPRLKVLVYGLYEGIGIAWYDDTTNTFYADDRGTVPVYHISAWQYLPDKPNTYTTIRDNITNKYTMTVTACKKENT